MTRPISFSVDRPARQARIHVVIRLALLVAIGSIGITSLYWLLYLALPVIVALVVSQKGGWRYFADDTQPITRVLRWLAGAYAYLWLLTDELPTSEPRGPVHLELEPDGTPTTGSALLRLVLSLPALVLLVLLSLVGAVLWVIGAFALLVREEMPASLPPFLEQVLRYKLRLVAYHLSLTGTYPSLEGEGHAPLGQQS